MSCKALVSVLSFCFNDLFIGVSGVLKFHTIIVVLSIYPFMSVFALCIEVFLCWMHNYLPSLCLLGLIT